MTPRLPLIALGLLLIFGLACSGLGTEEQAVDPEDPVFGMIERRDYAGAENALRRRLQRDPADVDARILLGDVNFHRGQDYRERWLENLGWARDQWMQAVRRDPTRCDAWRRLSLPIIALSIREDLATPAGRFDQLPLEQGWTHCPGSAILGILAARPTDQAVPPDLGQWLTQMDLSGLAWQPVADPVPLRPGAPFVVLDTPVQAEGIGRSIPRPFSSPEVVQISEAGSRIIFDDRRFPGKASAQGLTLATLCPGTRWTLEGPDRVPVGRCATSAQSAGSIPVYDPSRTEHSGPAHWVHSTFVLAQIPAEDIVQGSIRCTGGSVRRLFIDTPTCDVSYEKVIPQRRSIPASVGIAAHDADHAEKIRTARGLANVWGDELAGPLARGQVAIGMPHALFTWALANPSACAGRGLYNRAKLEGADLIITCAAEGKDWTFINFELAEISER